MPGEWAYLRAMGDLPRGTVTFVFTDIEGSTRLLRQLPEHYADVLAEHQRVLRAAFGDRGGCEVGTEGDASFFAFASGRDAIAAALAAQRALALVRWPEGADLRVRMGVHTGEADVRGHDYVGFDVHRASRICSAGHGGQILVSSATRELVADWLPPGVALRDLGEHSLKDLDRPEHLFQLVADDLPADFPPLRAYTAPTRFASHGALPRPRNRTIGREAAIRGVADRLRVGSVRVLTLTGPGGVGKTRLGLEAARTVQGDFADGAHFVSLAALRRAQDVPSAILQALGIVPLAGESPERALTRELAARHLLLVLDNFEHVLAAARFLPGLLSTCPALTVLATSREALALTGEERYPVVPLALPLDDAGLQALARAPAVALFAERALACDPGFALTDDNLAAIVEICRRLDGLPLAIELAAARCALMSPPEIADRLDAALAVLGRGPRDAPARQQTMRATIDWSVRLLSAEERRAFTRFAVFPGGATVTTAEAVTSATLDALDSLVVKQLIVRAHDRLAMLEITHEYAAELLAGDPDADRVRERHAVWCLKLVEEHAPRLVTAQRAASLSQLESEMDSIRAALSWAIHTQRGELAVTLAGALGPYWWRGHRDDEGRGWLDAALQVGLDAPASARATALVFRARVNRRLPRRTPEHDLSAAAELFRSADDPAGLAKSLAFLAVWERHHGDSESAQRRLDEAVSIARRTDDPEAMATALAAAVIGAADYAAASRVADEAVATLARVGNILDVGSVYADTGLLAIRDGRYAEALPWLERALTVARRLDDPFALLIVQGNQGLAHVFLEHIEPAKRSFSQSLQLCRNPAFHGLVDEGMLGLAAVAVLEERPERAARLVGAARAHADAGSTVDDDVIFERLRARFLSPARHRYGRERWDRDEQQGGALTFVDALEFALEGWTARSRSAAASRGDKTPLRS